jgi:hypothetical protein
MGWYGGTGPICVFQIKPCTADRESNLRVDIVANEVVKDGHGEEGGNIRIGRVYSRWWAYAGVVPRVGPACTCLLIANVRIVKEAWQKLYWQEIPTAPTPP